MAKVIGIMGLAGAGKDTVAQMLQRGLVAAGFTNVVIGGFADYLREISKDVGLDPFNRDIKEVPHVISHGDLIDRLYDATEQKFCRILSMNDRASLFAYTLTKLEKKFLRDEKATYPYFELSPRQFMQTIGEAGRLVRPTFWIELAQRKWKALPGIVLVTDCRFDNEAAVAEKVLLVVRSDVALVSPHVSEQLASDLTSGQRSIPGQELILNQGSLEDLEVEVATMATSYALLFARILQES
jgi:hypothetical protein